MRGNVEESRRAGRLLCMSDLGKGQREGGKGDVLDCTKILRKFQQC